MNKSEKDNAWLQPVLRQGLARVPAPRDLWDQVTGSRTREAERARPVQRIFWAFAGASVLTASVLAVAWAHQPSQRVEFRSERASLMRGWVRDRTGLDIPFVAQPNPRIELVGARLPGKGQVEVHYRADHRDAVLLVSNAGGSTPGQTHLRAEDIRGAKTVSWTSGDHVYSLAVERGGDLRVACLVCHAESTI